MGDVINIKQGSKAFDESVKYIKDAEKEDGTIQSYVITCIYKNDTKNTAYSVKPKDRAVVVFLLERMKHLLLKD